jgi:hypothetical protein
MKEQGLTTMVEQITFSAREDAHRFYFI